MKNIIASTLALLICISCKAQTPVVSIEAKYYETPVGAYFKDLNNDMDKFVGTWQFTQGNNVFTVVIQKKLMVNDGEYYQDLLIGEYKYAVNGTEIINTIPLLTDNVTPILNHNIFGRRVVASTTAPLCPGCNAGEQRFKLAFFDPERDYLRATHITLRYLTGATPNQMTATIASDHGVMLPNEGAPQETRVPYGEYLMVKQ